MNFSGETTDMSDCDLEWNRFLNGEDISLYQEAVDKSLNSKELENDILRKVENIKIDKNIEKLVSPINISTTTKITYLNKTIDLKRDFWKIDVMDYYTPEEGVIKKQMKYIIQDDDEQQHFNNMVKSQKLYVELMDLRKKNIIGTNKKTGSNVYKVSIGVRSKDIINQKAKKTQAFFNCFVLVIRMKELDTNKFMEAHMKIFNTGKIEIPGMKNNDMFYRVLEIFKSIYKRDIGENVTLKKNDLETILINSNFNCGFYINREKLYHILKKKYNLNCSYDPCTYPGIQNIFYFDKNDKDIDFNGIIKNNKDGTLQEKKHKNYISFMVFRTGSVLVVGKCDEDILMKIYNFIKTLLVCEYDVINSGLNDYSEKIKNTNKQYRPIKCKTTL